MSTLPPPFEPKVRLIWATPDLERNLMYCARVSSNDQTSSNTRLINYLINQSHWSPFEMVSICIEVETTRDISRQVLRHGKGFSFQEFSQRYQVVPDHTPPLRECRLQDPKRRQCSSPTPDQDLAASWAQIQMDVYAYARAAYETSIGNGIAREVARCLLPEGLTLTKFYMAGPLRSWIHYCNLRVGNGTQPEHIAVARAARVIVAECAPVVAVALQWRPPIVAQPTILQIGNLDPSNQSSALGTALTDAATEHSTTC